MAIFKGFFNKITYGFVALSLLPFAVGAMDNPEIEQKSYRAFINEYKNLFLDEHQKLYLEGNYQEAKKKDKELDQQKNKFLLEDFSAYKRIRATHPGNEIPTEESLIIRERQDKLVSGISDKINKAEQYHQQECMEIEETIKKAQNDLKEIDVMVKEKKETHKNQQAELESNFSKIIKRHTLLEKILPISIQSLNTETCEKIGITGEEIKEYNQFQLFLILDLKKRALEINESIKINEKKIVNSIEYCKNIYEKIEYDIQEKCKKLEFIKKTHEDKIKKLEQQLSLIKENSFFLSPAPKPRSIIHGESEASASSLGQGIIIGIIDFFPTDLSAKTHQLITSGKVINPMFNGSKDSTEDSFKGVREALGIHKVPEEDSLHGVGVASIAASNDIHEGLVIGQAPDADIEYLDHRKLTSFNGISTSFVFPKSIYGGKSRIEAHAAFLDSLPTFKKGEIYPIQDLIQSMGVEFDSRKAIGFIDIHQSPILHTQAKVVNISASTYGARHTETETPSAEPESDLESFIQYRALADMGILSISTLGNDGIYVTTSWGYALKKALVKAEKTRTKTILVGNLMEDGLTIASHSNQPGEDIYLQQHTIFALGTNVPCLSLETNSYIEESGTSFAAPHVSGAAAIIMSSFPSLSAEKVSECLLKGATPIFIGDDGLPTELSDPTQYAKFEEKIQASHKKYGMGRLNISNALELAGEANKTEK